MPRKDHSHDLCCSFWLDLACLHLQLDFLDDSNEDMVLRLLLDCVWALLLRASALRLVEMAAGFPVTGR